MSNVAYRCPEPSCGRRHFGVPGGTRERCRHHHLTLIEEVPIPVVAEHQQTAPRVEVVGTVDIKAEAQRLRDQGNTVRAVARLIGKSPSWVDKYTLSTRPPSRQRLSTGPEQDLYSELPRLREEIGDSLTLSTLPRRPGCAATALGRSIEEASTWDRASESWRNEHPDREGEEPGKVSRIVNFCRTWSCQACRPYMVEWRLKPIFQTDQLWTPCLGLVTPKEWWKWRRKVMAEEIKFNSVSVTYRDRDGVLVLLDTEWMPKGSPRWFQPYEQPTAIKLITYLCVLNHVSRWVASEEWRREKESDGGDVFMIGSQKAVDKAFGYAGYDPDGQRVDHLPGAKRRIQAYLDGIGLEGEEDG